MDFEKLETFVSVARNLSFTKAAKELYCSQATVTLRIKYLEEKYKVILFNREGRSIYLTSAGFEMLEQVKKILESLDVLEESMLTFKNEVEGDINIMASNTPGTYLLPQFMIEFKNKYPKLNVLNYVTYSRDSINYAVNNRNSIAIVSQPDINKFEYADYYKIIKDPMVVICSNEHKWAERKTVSSEELLDEVFLLTNKGSSMLKYLDEVTNSKIQIKNINIIGNIEALKRAVVDNIGVSIVSKFAVATESDLGLLKTLDLNDIELERYIFFVKKKDVFLGRGEEVFLEEFSKYCKDRY